MFGAARPAYPKGIGRMAIQDIEVESSVSRELSPTTAVALAGRPRRRLSRPPVLGVAGFVAFILIWWAAVASGAVNSMYVPTPAAVGLALVESFGNPAMWAALGQTLYAWAIGFAIAVLLGLVVGFLIGSNRFLRKATHSTVEFLRPIPSVALIPIVVLVLGVSLQAELFIIAAGCFWLVLIQVIYGVGDIDKVAQDTIRTLRLKPLARVRYLVWPTTLPYFMTGVRLAATVALILAVTSELILGTPGLGSAVARAQSNNQSPQMYAYVVIVGIVAVIVNQLARLIEKRVLFWHSSVRKGVVQ